MDFLCENSLYSIEIFAGLCYTLSAGSTVFLAGLKKKAGSALDFSSFVGIIGMLTTIHNSTLTLVASYGFVKGVISMTVILLVVGVCGTETQCAAFFY